MTVEQDEAKMSADSNETPASMEVDETAGDGRDDNKAADDVAADDDEDDEKSVSSTDSDDSDADTSPIKDPEVLLIKATQLKEEGNNYFKEKDFEKASRMYRRGTNTLKPLNKGNTGDEQVKALLISLQTNLSMMCFKLDKYRQSSQVASSVLKIDAQNVKALYRRAVAERKLGNHEEARRDLREALKQEPTNVTVKKELASLKKELEDSVKVQKQSLARAFSKGGGGLYDDKVVDKKKREQEDLKRKKEAEEALKKRKVEWEDECVKRMAKGEQAISFEEWEKEKEQEKKKKEEEEKRQREEKRKAREAAKANEKNNDSESDDELTEKELAQLRGYKKTSDGRVTSYFTREVSVEEKKIIGDIAPKRLEEANSAPQRLPDSTGSEGTGGSKWNKAGTWEEKDTTEWCRERLVDRLKQAKSESASLVGVVTGVKDMTGDASVAVVNGKKRYIFDFHCNLTFDIRESESDEVVASGSFKIPDVCSTHHDELEVDFSGWKKAPSSSHETMAVECRLVLTSAVRESVKLWVEDFNNQY